MNRLLLILGILVFADGLYVLKYSNFSLGILMTLVGGVVLILWGAVYNALASTCAGSVVNTVLLILLLLYAVFACVIFALGRHNNTGYDEDAVIVLGCGIRGDKPSLSLLERLDSALEYHRKNPSAYIVVSGGQGPQETITEAEAMERYLLNCGAAKEKILKEERSTSTEENLRFSKRILEEKLGSVSSAAVITNDYHIYRSSKLAADEGFSRVTHKFAPTPSLNIIPGILRESVAIAMYWFRSLTRK